MLKGKKELTLKLAELDKANEEHRRKTAELETKEFEKRVEINQFMSQLSSIEERLAELSKAEEAVSGRLGTITQSESGVKSTALAAAEEVSRLQTECANLYGVISNVLSGQGKHRKNAERIEQAKALEKEIRDLELQHASTLKENEMTAQRVGELRSELMRNSDVLKETAAKAKELQSSIAQLERRKQDLQEAIKSHDSKSSSLYQQLSNIDEQISKLSFERGKMSGDMDRINRELIISESARSQQQTRLNDIKAELLAYTDAKELQERDIRKLEERLAASRAELASLGNVNLKAPEMFEVRSREAGEAKEKLSTLESEKASIISMIDEIDSKKLGVFNETLASVAKNFEKLYGYIFEGTAKLQLSDPKDPFNSGLMVYINRKGIKNGSADSMSGGEKSLIALILVFSIQMRNPKSFYLLDEIDAALDKENTKKLSKLIKELSASSQFIVVSHNDTMIAAADTAIGVVKKDGESKVVGIQVTQGQRNI
jgi:chromosome segregation protein